MTNLIAYIPVLNQMYLSWIEKHLGSPIFLITDSLAISLNSSLARNMISVPTVMISRFIMFAYPSVMVVPFSDPDGRNLDIYLGKNGTIIMPDEDVCHTFAERYLFPKGYKVEFEEVWGRWDMTAVKRHEPVIPDLEISSEEVHQLRMEAARKLAKRSPDWWRQVAALAFLGDELIACSYNAHKPTEYETMLFGDPRINFNAGDPAGVEVYLSLHAEKGLIGICAREGIKLKGASVYVTTFPCADCARYLAECKIKELFFIDGYSLLGGLRTLQAARIRIVKVNI